MMIYKEANYEKLFQIYLRDHRIVSRYFLFLTDDIELKNPLTETSANAKSK